MSIKDMTAETANKILQRRADKESWDESDWEWLVSLTGISQEEWNGMVNDGNRTLHEEEETEQSPAVQSLQEMLNHLISERKAHDAKMAQLDAITKQSGDQIEGILQQLIDVQNEQEKIKQQNSADVRDLHVHIRESEERLQAAMGDKVNAITRRLDKMTTTEEASTVQFKSAVEDQGQDAFHQMASVVSDLVDRRNKKSPYSSADTPVRPRCPEKQPFSTPNFSKQGGEQLPQIGLSPVQSQDSPVQSTTQTATQSTNLTLPAKGGLLGLPALQTNASTGNVAVTK